VNWIETIRTGLSAVRSHRMRSILTMLGILIGIAAVILTVGLGEGAQQQVGSEISALGSNLLIVFPGQYDEHCGSPWRLRLGIHPDDQRRRGSREQDHRP
jgi:putative ABC transport system permease protein